MKLFYAPTSPYVRKVMVIAHATGQIAEIELVAVPAQPLKWDEALAAHNPLGKIPALATEDGVLFDSPVICEYLDTRAGGDFFPASGPPRWRALTQQALADGLLDAALLARYETLVRPADFVFWPWRDAQIRRIESALDGMESEAGALGSTIGAVSFGCALGYLDFRFSDLAWRDRRPTLAGWFASYAASPEMQATRPPG